MAEKLRILLAEDNPTDVLLVRHVLDTHQIPNELTVITDGADALGQIERIGHPGGLPLPDLLLLDMNLPKVDGPQILQKFREHHLCASVPVIVISSSDQPRDRNRVVEFGVTYFRKPADYDQLLELGTVVKNVVGDHSFKASAS